MQYVIRTVCCCRR